MLALLHQATIPGRGNGREQEESVRLGEYITRPKSEYK